MKIKSGIVALSAFIIVTLSCVSLFSSDKPLRGVWLTNVDSHVLWSEQEIEEAVNVCSEAGINTIFVVTFNKGNTTYPSAVMEKTTGVKIDSAFTGRDPLKELIEAAHKKDIKVIAWFEFGFSCSYNLNGGEILKRNPGWASAGVDGKLVTKNGFDWMNGFLPEVQDFMLSLILEVTRNYDIDGVQGDDRLPAMPVEAGYDKYTVERYKSEHNGAEPPKDIKDPKWVQWRAGLMTEFMKRIYTEVKKVNKNALVAMAPSIFPWGRDQYLQDWPLWVKNKYVDLIIPQLYRYNITEYKKLLNKITGGQIDRKDLKMFYPGILLKIGLYNADPKFLKKMVAENRKKGVNGEVFFFYEGIKKYPEVFKEMYK